MVSDSHFEFDPDSPEKCQMTRLPHRARWIGALCLVANFGCAATPYQYGQFNRAGGDSDVPPAVVIEQGKPNKKLDRLAWIVGTPERILSMNKKVNAHQLSPETTEKLKAYLEKNDLTDVYVYVNHYDPAGQWQRLKENKQMSPVWRYTFGAFSFVGYTLLPRRVFGGDQYNPYTNSLYLNSDVPAVVLHEAAFAKDVHSRKLPGTYAAVNDLPFVSMWHETLAVNDVLGYAQAENDWETEQQTYKVLYPKMGADGSMVGGPFISFWWAAPVLRLGGAAAGHVAGRTVAARREAQVHAATDPTDGSTDAADRKEFAEASQPTSRTEASSLERLPRP